jgi:SAM-dependent methyltransferase
LTEAQWDKLLRVKTSGRDDSHADRYRYPYEPTPYSVLERLAGSGFITKKNILLDYGCGKGRTSFFLANQLRCRCIGVEYDDRTYESAVRNKEAASAGGRTAFVHARAETWPLPDDVDRIYFFNPFSVEILQKVLGRIRESFQVNPREILLFFYYPSDEYVVWTMTVSDIMFMDEIYCGDLFEGESKRERIMVFEMGYLY